MTGRKTTRKAKAREDRRHMSWMFLFLWIDERIVSKNHWKLEQWIWSRNQRRSQLTWWWSVLSWVLRCEHRRESLPKRILVNISRIFFLKSVLVLIYTAIERLEAQIGRQNDHGLTYGTLYCWHPACCDGVEVVEREKIPVVLVAATSPVAVL